MKKLFAIFAAALIAFGMSSCKKNNGTEPDPQPQPQPEKKEGFAIEVSKITHKAATIKVTPADTSVSYYSQVVTKIVYDEAYKGDDAKLLENIQKSVKEEYQHAGSIAGWVKGGEHTYKQGDLYPEAEYLAIVVLMDKEGNIPEGAKMYSKVFKTEKAPLTLTIQINDVYSDAVSYSIIPSDTKQSFFFYVKGMYWVEGKEDEELIEFAKEMSASERGEHMWTGEMKDAIYVEGLLPETQYTMFAFYMDKDGNVPAGAKVVRSENFKTLAK